MTTEDGQLLHSHHLLHQAIDDKVDQVAHRVGKAESKLNELESIMYNIRNMEGLIEAIDAFLRQKFPDELNSPFGGSATFEWYSNVQYLKKHEVKIQNSIRELEAQGYVVTKKEE